MQRHTRHEYQYIALLGWLGTMYLHNLPRCAFNKIIDGCRSMARRHIKHPTLDDECITSAIPSAWPHEPLIAAYVSKNFWNFEGSSVADIMTSLSSFTLLAEGGPCPFAATCLLTSAFRIRCILLRAPQRKSVLRVRSCASSMTTTSYWSKRFNPSSSRPSLSALSREAEASSLVYQLPLFPSFDVIRHTA